MGTGNSYEAVHTIFHPRSIAIIGASGDFNKLGGKPIDNLRKQGYQGRIYPINPSYDEIAGLKVYANVCDIEGEVDVALILLTSDKIKQSIVDCAKKGVKVAAILSAGFAESGDEGEKLQEEIIGIAKSHGMRLFGPNCVGVANLLEGTPISFVSSFSGSKLVPGDVGLVSQSGGVGFNLLNLGQSYGTGFGYWATTGNEADLGFLDFVSYLLEQPEVNAIGGYIEQIKDGTRFLEIARRAKELHKPFITIKVGSSKAGQRAVTSHTGALAGADVVYNAAFHQHNVVRVKNKDELLDTLQLAVTGKKPKGRRLGIVTISGGKGIMMTDYAEEVGLEVPMTTNKTQQEIMKIFPSYGSAKNPIDATAQVTNNREIYKACIDLVLREEQFDVIILDVANNEVLMNEVADWVHRTDKLVCILGTRVGPETQANLRAKKTTYFTDFYRCIKAIANLVEYHENLSATMSDGPEDEPVLPKIDFPSTGGSIGELEVKRFLRSFVSVPDGGIARTANEASQLARTIGYPVVMKVNSPDISHKTDVGGVRINLKDDSEAESAFNEIMESVQNNVKDARVEGVLIEKFVNEKGIEVVIGFNRDPVFGHSLTFGLGGVFVEVIRDISTRVLPVSRSEVRRMIREIKGWPLLDGFRDKVTYDVEALEETIVKLAKFVELHADHIDELEINPLKVLPAGKGVYLLDSLLKLRTR